MRDGLPLCSAPCCGVAYTFTDEDGCLLELEVAIHILSNYRTVKPGPKACALNMNVVEG
jgi:hypothetical protein